MRHESCQRPALRTFLASPLPSSVYCGRLSALFAKQEKKKEKVRSWVTWQSAGKRNEEQPVSTFDQFPVYNFNVQNVYFRGFGRHFRFALASASVGAVSSAGVPDVAIEPAATAAGV